MGEKEETEAAVVFGDGGGEERMTEEEEGYLTLTDLGERLLILRGCTNVFTQKVRCLQMGGSSKHIEYLYKVRR